MALERVQKILAKAGIASRRKAEELITLGEVTINGKPAKLGDKAELGKDAIKVKGKLLQGVQSTMYLAFHKPRNVVSTLADPEGRPSIGDYLKQIKTRVYPVGRLDFTSEGLILLTNDGDLAEKVQKRDDIPRVYHVKVKGHPDKEMVSRLERGGRIENRLIKPHSVRIAKDFTNKSLIEVVILGGGAMDIKTLFETRGFLVERIVRVAIGHLKLKYLPPGKFEHLKASSVEALLTQPELALKRIEQRQQEERERSFVREKLETKRAAKRAEWERTAADRPAPLVKPGPRAGRPGGRPMGRPQIRTHSEATKKRRGYL